MKLARLRICGFRGFRSAVDISFESGFTVIDGRNGVGKTTLCDAVEFALTGEIGRYKEVTADRESIKNYIWWRGESSAPDHYVELHVCDSEGSVSRIKRSRQGGAEGLEEITSVLIDRILAPSDPLRQLCQTLIIRDEFIERLSLELKETERFQFLREALGSIEAEEEIKRAESISKLSKKRLDGASNAVVVVRGRLTDATKRIDEARSALADDASLSNAGLALKTTLGVEAPLEELAAAAGDLFP